MLDTRPIRRSSLAMRLLVLVVAFAYGSARESHGQPVAPAWADAVAAVKHPATTDSAAHDAERTLVAHRKRLDAAAIAALAKGLDSADRKVRWRCAGVLRALGPVARPAVPALVAKVRDPHTDLRAMAALVLGAIGAPPDDAVAAVTDLLDSPDQRDREVAAFALGEFGERAAPAIPRLIELLDEPSVAPSAALALGRIGPRAAPAVPRLLERLAAGEDHSRASAARALGGVRVTSDQVMSALVNALDDPAIRHAAIESLGTLGRPVPGADEKIRQLAKEPRLRVIAAVALARLGHADEGIGMLREDALAAKPSKEAVDALAALGDAGLPILREAIRTNAPASRWAIQTLAGLGPSAAPAVTELADVLARGRRGSDRGRFDAALETLDELGPVAHAALPALRAARDRESAAAVRARIDEVIASVEAAPSTTAATTRSS